jgi:hypothetical protein
MKGGYNCSYWCLYDDDRGGGNVRCGSSMTGPDPDFLAFFAGDWQQLLKAVEIPGMNEPSWDRRAAYLLWCMGSHYVADTDNGYAWVDVLMGLVVPWSPKPLSEVLIVHKEDTTKFPYAPDWNTLYQAELGSSAHSVGSVNPIEDADCLPTPGGVSFTFDAVKVSGENG